MPKQTNSVCSICKLSKSIYKCPQDQIVYCSVRCFRIHKDESNCPGTSQTKSVPVLNDLESPRKIDHERLDQVLLSAKNEKKKLRKLKDLNWPLVDHDQLEVFSDPLRRDELKPIRKHEWEMIATSTALRSLLINSTELKNLITQIVTDHDAHPKSGSNLESGSKLSTDDVRQGLIKDLLLGIHLAHLPHLSSLDNDQVHVFNQFAEIVRNILDQSRSSHH